MPTPYPDISLSNPSAEPRNTRHRARAFDHLLLMFAQERNAPPLRRWLWLEAAHVLGQPSMALHWRSHTTMLRYAIQQRDLGEVQGQLLRLALVPLGHWLSRLPAGNVGRAYVSAFRPMAPDPALQALIGEALQATAVAADTSQNR